MDPSDVVNANYNPIPHLLAFVDALGFSREMQKADPKIIKEYFRLIDHVKKSWKKRDGKGELLKVTTIGDSVILGMESDGEVYEGSLIGADENFLARLYNLAFAVAELQAGLAYINIWTRGAITYDFVHFEPGRIVGPAFHRAYYLESKVALYPRVILDGGITKAAGMSTSQELVERIDGNVLYDFEMHGSSNVRLRRDVPTFVNFSAVAPAVTDPVSWVVRCAEFLSDRLKQNVEHFVKYRWLADYLLQYAEGAPILLPLKSEQLEVAKQLLREG